MSTWTTVSVVALELPIVIFTEIQSPAWNVIEILLLILEVRIPFSVTIRGVSTTFFDPDSNANIEKITHL